MQGAIPSRHPKYRTKLCRNFASGDCPFGRKCSFLHSAQEIDLLASPVAQHVFPWNPLLLSQLLALSNQQVAMKKMPRCSPPRPQPPQLVEEDPSPTTSLLLSRSDCTSSERVSQRKRTNRRKKQPCRHFVRTGGWCPAGGQCRFRHDMDALPSPDVPKTEPISHSAGDACGEGGRTISGGVLMGRQPPSPPIVNQTHSDPPRYPEPEPMQPYPPMYWPSYTWQPYQTYYTAVPATTAIPIPATAAPPTIAQQSLYSPSQPPPQTGPQGEPRTSLPMRTYEMNGTTYFAAPAQPPMPYSLPATLPYGPTMAPTYPYYAPPGMPVGYYDANQTVAPQTLTAFDPFASERMEPSELPVIPHLEDYQVSPVEQDALALPSSVAVRSTAARPVPEDEFPYQPPKEQRVGHARRISVNIKKHVRASSG